MNYSNNPTASLSMSMNTVTVTVILHLAAFKPLEFGIGDSLSRPCQLASTYVLYKWSYLLKNDEFQYFSASMNNYRPTAIQAMQPCPLWELSPSHPILV